MSPIIRKTGTLATVCQSQRRITASTKRDPFTCTWAIDALCLYLKREQRWPWIQSAVIYWEMRKQLAQRGIPLWCQTGGRNSLIHQSTPRKENACCEWMLPTKQQSEDGVQRSDHLKPFRLFPKYSFCCIQTLFLHLLREMRTRANWGFFMRKTCRFITFCVDRMSSSSSSNEAENATPTYLTSSATQQKHRQLEPWVHRFTYSFVKE